MNHEGMDVNVQDQYGNTALHYAVENWLFRSAEWIAVIVDLLKAGASVDIKNNKDNTPFSVLSEQAVQFINAAVNSPNSIAHFYEMIKPTSNPNVKLVEAISHDGPPSVFSQNRSIYWHTAASRTTSFTPHRSHSKSRAVRK